MGRSNPVAERLIPNAGCANGANDHRIRHVGTIKQLGPAAFFPPFLQREKREIAVESNERCVRYIRCGIADEQSM